MNDTYLQRIFFCVKVYHITSYLFIHIREGQIFYFEFVHISFKGQSISKVQLLEAFFDVLNNSLHILDLVAKK